MPIETSSAFSFCDKKAVDAFALERVAKLEGFSLIVDRTDLHPVECTELAQLGFSDGRLAAREQFRHRAAQSPPDLLRFLLAFDRSDLQTIAAAGLNFRGSAPDLLRLRCWRRRLRLRLGVT